MPRAFQSRSLAACGAGLALVASSAAAQDRPVQFYGPNDPIPPGAVLPVPLETNNRSVPTWIRRVQPAFPAAASQAGVATGEVTLDCLMNYEGALTECRVESERPTDLGFGEAALQATGTALLRPAKDGDFLITGRITFAVHFDSAYTQPQWRRVPEPLYPEAADEAGIYEGRATVQCAASVAGVLSDCEVLTETPAGYGFGEALVTSTRDASVHPRMVDGEPTAGVIRFSTRFRIEPPQPAVQGVQPQRLLNELKKDSPVP